MTDGERLEHFTLVMKASKEEMADEIICLRRENRELKERLEKEAAKEAERKSHQQRKSIKTRWKKLGAPVGHHGATRPKPDHIDKTIDQCKSLCPYRRDRLEDCRTWALAMGFCQFASGLVQDPAIEGTICP